MIRNKKTFLLLVTLMLVFTTFAVITTAKCNIGDDDDYSEGVDVKPGSLDSLGKQLICMDGDDDENCPGSPSCGDDDDDCPK